MPVISIDFSNWPVDQSLDSGITPVTLKCVVVFTDTLELHKGNPI